MYVHMWCQTEKIFFMSEGYPEHLSRRGGGVQVHVDGALKRVHDLIRDWKWRLRIGSCRKLWGRCKTEDINGRNKCLTKMKNTLNNF